MIPSLAAAMMMSPPVSGPRVIRTAPFPALESALIDDRMASVGIANSISRQRGAQARILWVDATANMGAVNTPEKIEALVARTAKAGFNTIVFDVKPIIGYTLYPSRLTDQLIGWRSSRFEPGYDPIPPFVAACRRHGLGIYLALNAFSEGHRVVLDRRGEIKPLPDSPGWGYSRKDLQTVQYVPSPVWRAALGVDIPLAETPNPRALERPSVFLAEAALPSAAWFVAADAFGEVVSSGPAAPKAPEGGSVIALPKGEWADRVSQLALVGTRVRIHASASFVPISERQTQLPLMMNPHLEENQARALSFIQELVEKYPADGVIYDDRLRFGGLNADFSPAAKQQFEARVGRKLNWPDDVYRFTYSSRLNRGVDGRAFTSIRPGPYFDAWLAWRADTMARFIGRVREKVKAIRPSARLGVYAGSWYGDYAQYGNNYGSVDLNAGFPFMTPAYRSTGFASKLDFLITGCYYPVATMQEAHERGVPAGRTVEAGGILTNRVVRDQTWSYAGIMLADYFREPKMLEQALQAAAATTQGVMVFDLSHQMDRFWPVFDRAFRAPARAPHTVPGLLDAVRARRAAFDQSGVKDAPFPLLEGAPGAGF